MRKKKRSDSVLLLKPQNSQKNKKTTWKHKNATTNFDYTTITGRRSVGVTTANLRPIDHREGYMSCDWPFYSLSHTFPKALHSNKAVGSIWPRLNLLTGDKVMIFHPPPGVCLDSFSHQTWTCLQMGGAQPVLFAIRMSFIYFWYLIFITFTVCVSIFMTSHFGEAVGLLSI